MVNIHHASISCSLHQDPAGKSWRGQSTNAWVCRNHSHFSFLTFALACLGRAEAGLGTIWDPSRLTLDSSKACVYCFMSHGLWQVVDSRSCNSYLCAERAARVTQLHFVRSPVWCFASRNTVLSSTSPAYLVLALLVRSTCNGSGLLQDICRHNHLVHP